MEAWHISAELARRFLDQRVSPAERRVLVRHLLTQCTECVTLLGRITAENGYWFGKEVVAALPARGYDSAFESAGRFADREERRVALERLRGWGQWSSLEPLLPDERLAMVIGDPTYRSWGLFQSLLEAARWYSFRDPRQAVEVVQLAVDIVDLLDAALVGGREAAHDMRAKAWAILANNRRLAADLAGARAALAEAWSYNEKGTGDPLEKAQIYSFDASYVRQVGEFETAEAILERVLSIYQAVGDVHLQGRILIQMGNSIGYVNPDRAIAHLQRGLNLINAVREPRLELCAQNGLAFFLTEAGRPQEALAILDRSRSLYKQFSDDWTQLRLHWLQGKIARGLLQLTEAASIFRQVREEFESRGLHFDALMVTIDLAETYTAASQDADAARLLGEAIPLMTTWGLHRNSLAAWLLFQEVLASGQANEAARRALFARIRLYYQRHWHVPGAAEFSLE